MFIIYEDFKTEQSDKTRFSSKWAGRTYRSSVVYRATTAELAGRMLHCGSLHLTPAFKLETFFHVDIYPMQLVLGTPSDLFTQMQDQQWCSYELNSKTYNFFYLTVKWSSFNIDLVLTLLFYYLRHLIKYKSLLFNEDVKCIKITFVRSSWKCIAGWSWFSLCLKKNVRCFKWIRFLHQPVSLSS